MIAGRLRPESGRREPTGLATLTQVLVFAVLAVFMPISSAVAVSPSNGSGEVEEYWYRCTLGGRPCGRMHETTRLLDDGGTRTSVDLQLRFRRGDVATSTRIRTWIELAANASPRSMGILQELGGTPVTITWTFIDDDVVERRSQGGRTVETRHPRPSGSWHVPEAAMEIARDRSRVEGSSRVLVLDPARGLEPAMVEFRKRGTERITSMGAEVEAVRWEITDPDGSVAVEFFDADGLLRSSEVSMGAGLGVLRLALASPAEARSALEGDVELMEAGLVRPSFNGPARRLDRGGRATYLVRGLEGAPPPRFPDAGAQQVDETADQDVIRVEVGGGRTSPVGADFERARHLAATAVLDAGDPEVEAFARRHDRPGRPDEERARSLRTAVHRHISRKDLDIAFGTASETVRARHGDCTEHAVLLAAALRANGIPSRLVSGLVWIPRPGERSGAFLWHMWTQAVIEDRWLDLDPTLQGGVGFHPGHLAVAFSDGGAGDMEAGGRAMLDVFGAIEIEVLGPRSPKGASADD
ncbi:MAG: transglutaminase domain-containing protein [Phycisphaera sp.]|nr:transglutaminase domain-containing protein [Phycisphaera sp.]